MAPSGARRRLACGALVWLLTAQAFAQADHRLSAATSPPCNTIDSLFENALVFEQNTTSLSAVTLYDGCNTLTRNFVCSPIRSSLVINGLASGTSVWDTGFDMFQFSVKAGVTVTLRNVVLASALVFTVGYNNMQPALFHLPPGGRLALENVTIMSLCATSTYYWTQDAFADQQQSFTQPPSPSLKPGPIIISDLTKASISMRNVTLACDESVVPPTPVDLYVHTAEMFTGFASAASALTLTATITLMENITLPHIPALYNVDDPDPRITLVTTDIGVQPSAGTTAPAADGSNSSVAAPVTYIDCNYTVAWMYITPPSRLTLRRLVLTRLRPAIWAPGVLSGVLAGAMPLFMIETPSSAAASTSSPRRVFEDIVLAVPQYEVTQVSYWCTMMSVMAPEVSAASSFLRSLVWSLDCSVQEPTRVYLRRMRIASTLFTRVMLTSTPPAGVPFDPHAAPPAGSAAYEHVMPPLCIVSSSAEWAEAAAPVTPQDTVSSTPPMPRSSQSPSPPATAVTVSAALPALILLNGIVPLNATDLIVPDAGRRVVRRSVVVTCMRLGCTPAEGGGCTPCVLDMAGMFEAVRLEGPNTTVVFQDMTLRNVASTIMSAGISLSTVRGFFAFDRTSVHIVYERCTVELLPQHFADFSRALAPAGRVNLSGLGELAVMSITDNLIQVASFQVGGVRGSYVNFTPTASTLTTQIVIPSPLDPPGSPSEVLGSESSATVKTSTVVGACVGGGIAAGLLIAVVAWLLLTRRRRGAWAGYSLRGKAAKRSDSGGQGGDGSAHGGACAALGGDTSCLSTVEMQTLPGVSADSPEAGSNMVAAAAAASSACARCRNSEDRFDVESGPCGTGSNMSMDSSGDPTSLRAAVGQSIGPALKIPAVAAAAMAFDALPPMTAGSATRRSSGLFSLPEPHAEREVVMGLDASLSSSGGAAGVGGGAGSAGSAGQPCKSAGVMAPVRETASESAVEILERRYLRHTPHATQSSHVSDVAPLPLPILVDPGCSSHDASTSSMSASASVSTVGHGSVCSAVSARCRRQISGSRSHAVALEGAGRIPSLRVKTVLGRSPSRRGTRSGVSNSSSGGPNIFLPAPQPAMLHPSADAGRVSGVVAAPSSTSAHAGTGTAFHRSRSDRSTNPRGLGSTQQREGAPGTEHGASSAQLSSATCGTCDPNPYTATASQAFEADTSSPGMSLSISRIAEPASEVQRLISELSAQGSDHLVILEPIGQGGYGTVYRGIWRNLDVAVKTVLFQDQAALSAAPSPLLAGGESASSVHPRVVRSSLTEESEEMGRQVAAMLLKGRRSTDAACTPSNRISGAGRQLPQASNLRGLALRGPITEGHCTAPACPTCSRILADAGIAGTATGGGGDAGRTGSGGSGVGVGGSAALHWRAAGQPPINSTSLPNAIMPFLASGCGAPSTVPAPQGVASQQRAVLEAAVSCSVTHPNVVATYHYDITPVQPTGVVCSGGLHVSDGKRGFGFGAAGGAGAGGGGAVMRDWKLYLVQEFCDGGSLAAALDLRVFHDPAGLPNLALTLCALADITRGMAHIHVRSIVHGDLNPTNILLRSISGSSNSGMQPLWHRLGAAGGQGMGNAGGSGAALVSQPGGGVGGSSGCSTPGGAAIAAATALRHELGVSVVAKVADFGLCGMLAPGKRHISNALRGTPFYTSPETVATGTLTKASDVYSFGVIAWELYTGRPPFRHTTETGFVRDDSFPRMPPHAPPTFAKMVAACLAPDPEARPTFEQILDRLMHLQSKLAVSLHQRLTRLVGGNGVLRGTPGFATPAPPATATNSPQVSALHCVGGDSNGPGGSGFGICGAVGGSDGAYGSFGQGVGGTKGGSRMGSVAQAVQMPGAPVGAPTAATLAAGVAHCGMIDGRCSTGGPEMAAPIVAAHYTYTVTAPMAGPVLGG